MSDDPAALMARAARLLAERQPDQAAGLYMRIIGQAPAMRGAWHGLGLALARAGQLELVPGLVDLWGRLGGRRFDLLLDLFFVLLSHRELAAVAPLARLLALEGAEAAIADYAQASALILQDQEDAAQAHLDAFKDKVARYRDQLPIAGDQPFNVAYRQGTLVEDLAYVDALMAGPPASPPQPIPYAPIRQASSPQVLLAACNDKYFHLFAPDYCAALERVAPGALVHLHVMEPNADTPALARHLMDHHGGLVLNITHEPPHPESSRAYFASNRFLVAPLLMDIYGRDLLASDIDIAFVADPRDLAPRLAGQDFACYAYEDGFGPASRYIAYLCHLSHGTGGRQVLDVVNRFIHSKLHLRPPFNWMVDQAALYSGLRWLRHRRPEVVVGRMAPLLGRPASAIFVQQDKDEAKDAAIQAVVG
jgi:hypothetical protein